MQNTIAISKHTGIKIVLLFSLLIYLVGCNTNTVSENENEHISNSIITITDEQFETGEMELGDVSEYNFQNTVDCNGYVTAAPDGIESVSSSLSGIVSQIYVSAGKKVKVGDIICKLTSNEFITMQKEFAVTMAKLKQLTADYKRVESLYKQEIGSEKEFLSVEREYKVMQANYKALKIQLQQLHLNTDKIENGNFYDKLTIFAKINGSVSSVFVNLGQYAESGQILAEIVNPNSFQLKLSVFEKDIKFLEKGQEITFVSINNNKQRYNAILSDIGKSIDNNSKTITCFANIKSNIRQNFINNSFVNAQVITDKYLAIAITKNAIIEIDESYFVLVMEKHENNIYFFNKIRIQKGRESKDFIEIVDKTELKNILVNGVYNLTFE